MKKFLTFFLVIIIVFSCVVPVHAATTEPNEIQPLWTNINTIDLDLTFNSSTLRGLIDADLECPTKVDSITTSVIVYKKNLLVWQKIAEFQTTTVNNKSFCYRSLSFVAEEGKTYKVEYNYTVINKGITDSGTSTVKGTFN